MKSLAIKDDLDCYSLDEAISNLQKIKADLIKQGVDTSKTSIDIMIWDEPYSDGNSQYVDINIEFKTGAVK